jgi:hypothetical protein
LDASLWTELASILQAIQSYARIIIAEQKRETRSVFLVSINQPDHSYIN